MSSSTSETTTKWVLLPLPLPYPYPPPPALRVPLNFPLLDFVRSTLTLPVRGVSVGAGATLPAEHGLEYPHGLVSAPHSIFSPLQADIGNFNPASSSGLEGKDVAQLVNPKMRQSTDFPDWLGKAETKEALAGKTVLMYCTGGIRCERASALLRKKLGGAVGDVFQLQGGIEKYLLQFPDGGENEGNGLR